MKTIISIILLVLTLPSIAKDRLYSRNFATRSEVIGVNGMVCTSHPLATQIGLDILKAGGSAVDAAIAANAALGLMEPTGSGVGGDLFAIVWDAKTEKLYGLNASGRSPKDLSLEWFKENGYNKIPAEGPLPVSVPGAVDGWFELHKKFGVMDISKILEPTIKYAEEGFPVTETIAPAWNSSSKRYSKYPNVTETYTIDGKYVEKGDIFKNPYLANTLKKISKGGRDAFYKGEIAETIASFIQEQGGFLSKEDLATHHSEWVEPVSTNYRGYDIWELPPNGQGITTLQMLNILEGYSFSPDEYGSARHIHLVTEAKKLAFQDRAKYYADMSMADVPVEWLISKEYGAKRRALISETRAGVYEAGEEISKGETVYLTVADKDGNMVSFIQSNYRGMGSGMVPPKLGFMLQDRGELFSLNKGDANVFEPGKRPFHTIIPAFITKDGDPFISFGVMGGDFQPQGHVQIVMNIIDFKMNLQEAGDAPRMSHKGVAQPTGARGRSRGEISLESGFSFDVINSLMRQGHTVGFSRGAYGGYQAIMYDKDKGIYYGASESRKDGQAAGY